MMRCAATLWLASHDVIRRWKRDALGQPIVPHVLEWECLRCGRIVGTTTVAPLIVAQPRRRLHAITEKGRLMPDVPARRKDV